MALESFARSKAFDGVLKAILNLLDRDDEDGLPARAVATSAAGSIVACMTSEDQQGRRGEVVTHIATKALAGYAIDNAELREYTHLLFARLADSLGAEIVMAFGLPVIQDAINSLRRDDGIFLNADGQEINPIVEEDTDNDDDDDEAVTFSVRTALMDEKVTAAEVCTSAHLRVRKRRETSSKSCFVAPIRRSLARWRWHRRSRTSIPQSRTPSVWRSQRPWTSSMTFRDISTRTFAQRW